MLWHVQDQSLRGGALKDSGDGGSGGKHGSCVEALVSMMLQDLIETGSVTGI